MGTVSRGYLYQKGCYLRGVIEGVRTLYMVSAAVIIMMTGLAELVMS